MCPWGWGRSEQLQVRTRGFNQAAGQQHLHDLPSQLFDPTLSSDSIIPIHLLTARRQSQWLALIWQLKGKVDCVCVVCKQPSRFSCSALLDLFFDVVCRHRAIYMCIYCFFLAPIWVACCTTSSCQWLHPSLHLYCIICETRMPACWITVCSR